MQLHASFFKFFKYPLFSLPSFTFFLIFLEGYIVLSTEMLVIRQLTVFVGSGADTMAIIISSVLLPLAFGYYIAGSGRCSNIRKTLLRNCIISLSILTLALPYACLLLTFSRLEAWGIHSSIIQTMLYCTFFVAPPMFFLSQTIPLLSRYHRKGDLAATTSKVLFFSTLGSFTGALATTMFWMAYVGVHGAIVCTLLLILLMILCLVRKVASPIVLVACILGALAWRLNHQDMLNAFHIVSDNQYHTIQVIPLGQKGEDKIMSINHSFSSKIAKHRKNRFPYAKIIEDTYLRPLYAQAHSKTPIKQILIIGAGGFTLGLEDKHNAYTFIDVDPQLKNTAETHFIGKKLPPNKHYIAQTARAFLTHNAKRYDLIIVDAFNHKGHFPPEVITQEFYNSIANTLLPGGYAVFNVISDPNLQDPFSQKLHNTITHTFPGIFRTIAKPHNPWDLSGAFANIIYAHRSPLHSTKARYSDNLSAHFKDFW